MNKIISFFTVFISIFIFSIGIIYTYEIQFAEMYNYLGFINLDFDFKYILSLFSSIVIMSILIPYKVKKPSDMFSIFYGLFIIAPYFCLYQIRDSVNGINFFLYFCILLFPLIIIKFTSRFFYLKSLPGIFTESSVQKFAFIVCILGIIIGVYNSPSSASWSLLDSYDRRFDSREIYSSGSLKAYISDAVINGFVPFLAFYSVLHNKKYLLFFSIICCLIYYYSLGLKAPFFYISIAFIIGYAIRHDKLVNFFKIIISFILIIFIASSIELIFSDYSFIGDYIIRRALVVPPYLISAYFDYLQYEPGWSILMGLPTSKFITYEIGEVFLGVAGLNANTNAFLTIFASRGLFGYFFTVIIVAIVFLLLDNAYYLKRRGECFFVSFLFSVLLTEQAATTALVSSGVGLLLLLVIFSKNNSSE